MEFGQSTERVGRLVRSFFCKNILRRVLTLSKACVPLYSSHTQKHTTMKPQKMTFSSLPKPVYTKPEGMANYSLVMVAKVRSWENGAMFAQPVDGWKIIPRAEHLALKTEEFDSLSAANARAEELRAEYWFTRNMGGSNIEQFSISITNNNDRRTVYLMWFDPHSLPMGSVIRNKKRRK